MVANIKNLNSSNSTVSVVIPTRNRPDMLARALESVLGQSRLPDEIIIVDDASTVSYQDTINAARNINNRVPLIYRRLERSLGGSAARNTGAETARGDILMFLDDDDIWLPQKISNQLDIFFNYPRAGLVYSGRQVVNEHGEKLFLIIPRLKGAAQQELLQKNHIGTTSSVAVRQDVFRKAGGFDPQMPALQDYDLWIRISKITEIAFDPEPVVHWTLCTKNNNQMTGKPELYERAVKILLNKHRTAFESLTRVQRRKAMANLNSLIADKYSRQNSPRRFRFILRSLSQYPSLAAVSRLLPYSYWLNIRIRRSGKF